MTHAYYTYKCTCMVQGLFLRGYSIQLHIHCVHIIYSYRLTFFGFLFLLLNVSTINFSYSITFTFSIRNTLTIIGVEEKYIQREKGDRERRRESGAMQISATLTHEIYKINNNIIEYYQEFMSNEAMSLYANT